MFVSVNVSFIICFEICMQVPAAALVSCQHETFNSREVQEVEKEENNIQDTGGKEDK